MLSPAHGAPDPFLSRFAISCHFNSLLHSEMAGCWPSTTNVRSRFGFQAWRMIGPIHLMSTSGEEVTTGGFPRDSYMYLWKLAQKAHVVLEQHGQLTDAVLHHGKAVHAHAEGKSRKPFRIVIHEAVDGGVDHARAEQLDPARMFADAAAASATHVARGVHFCGWLCEREEARPQARLHLRPEERTHEILHRAFEIAECNVCIDCETFDLMEHVAVRRVGIVAPVDFSGHDDAHGRLLLLHGAD